MVDSWIAATMQHGHQATIYNCRAAKLACFQQQPPSYLNWRMQRKGYTGVALHNGTCGCESGAAIEKQHALQSTRASAG